MITDAALTKTLNRKIQSSLCPGFGGLGFHHHARNAFASFTRLYSALFQ